MHCTIFPGAGSACCLRWLLGMWLRGDALLCSLGQGPHAQRSKRVLPAGWDKIVSHNRVL